MVCKDVLCIQLKLHKENNLPCICYKQIDMYPCSRKFTSSGYPQWNLKVQVYNEAYPQA